MLTKTTTAPMFALVAFSLSLCLNCFAQGQAIIRTRTAEQDGDNPPVVQDNIVVLESSLDGASATYALQALPMSGSMVFSSPGMFSGDPSQMIMDSQIKQHLELDKDQLNRLRDIQKDFASRMKSEINIGNGADPARMKNISRLIKEINEERKAAVGAVLLPHQSKRLQQIALQMKMKSRGDANTLVSSEVSEELGIDDEQKKRLRKRAAEIKKEMEEEIARVKEAARKKLMRELSPEQRRQLDEMMGEKFERKKVDFRRFRSRQKDNDDN